MGKMKNKLVRLLTGVIALTMLVLATAACGEKNESSEESQNAPETSTQADETDTDVDNSEDVKSARIGVIQFMEHPSLDQAYNGFVDYLAENGYVEGENLEIDFQNAQGEQANCQTIAGQFSTAGYDVILAIATPAAQAVANVITDTPILVTAVTDLESTQLVDSNEAPGGNVSGTSDMTPIYDQIELIQKLFPDVKELGIIYSSGEPNSELQVEGAIDAAAKLGMNVTDVTISSTNEIQQVTESIIANVEAIYLPSDNAIASSMPTVAKVALDHNVPIIPAVEAMCAEGGIASIAINYYNLGGQTGAMALRILEEGADPATMPVEFTTNPELVINHEYAELIGYTFPDDILADAREAQVD
ncbi:MAG TPA: ABC transporter substrate-binding protein [Clostridiaceae bacterium]|nr:ABC transporter substrate-binding protein [Clostridiaceae bacterium]